MILYLLDGCGVFGEEVANLPLEISTVPTVKGISLDGKPLPQAGGRVRLPAGMPAGDHVLTADGRVAVFRVQSGYFCADFNPKLLLPTVARLCNLEGRLKKIEQKLADSEVDWLK